MKNRPARVKELILRELGSIIARDMTFTAKLVTVHGVDLTADFKHCHVHVGVLGSSQEQRKAIGKLHELRPVLQHELSRRVILKFTPQLHFHLDEAIERGTKVMEIMRQIDEVAPLDEPEDGADAAVNEGEAPGFTSAGDGAEEEIENSEDLVRLEEADDEKHLDEDSEPPDARGVQDFKPKGRRAEDAARFKEEAGHE